MSPRSMYWGVGAYSGVGLADPSCMGKGKGRGHVVVNVHGCISVCPELVLPSKCHHPMELLGSVLLWSWWGGKPLGVLWVKIVLYFYRLGLLSIEQLSSSSNINWWCTVLRLPHHSGEYAWGVVGMIHDTGMVLYVVEWEYLSFHSHCHNLHLPGQGLSKALFSVVTEWYLFWCIP